MKKMIGPLLFLSAGAFAQEQPAAFFHFGINTFTDREWVTGKDDISLFNPAKLDAKQWVRTAAAAGIRQAILTAKHHCFCLCPGMYTEHSVQHTPWKDGPPDKDGLINENDINSLKGWRKKMDACFAVNLAEGASLRPAKGSPAGGERNGSSGSEARDSTRTIDLSWRQAKTFDVLLLHEDI